MKHPPDDPNRICRSCATKLKYETNSNFGMQGKKQSEKQKAAISSPEARAKKSASLKGHRGWNKGKKIHTDAYLEKLRQRMRDDNPSFRDDVRDKLSASVARRRYKGLEEIESMPLSEEMVKKLNEVFGL